MFVIVATGTVFKKSQNTSKQYGNDSISNISTVDIQIENLLNSNDLDASDFFHITPKHVNGDVRVAYMQKLFRPDRQYEFPAKFLHGCKRSLSYRLLNENPFLVYCLQYVLFAKGTYDKRSSFVQPDGLSQWHKLCEKIEKHLRCGLDKAEISIHSQSMTDEILFKNALAKPAQTIRSMPDTTLQKRIEENRAILRDVFLVIILCGKQCISYRRHRENINDTTINSGNYLAILRLIGQYRSELGEQLSMAVAKNAKYTSPTIQNEIIDIIAYDILQAKLIKEIKDAKFFSILADEVENHHVEQLPICIRFVDANSSIREEFLEFGRCKRLNREAIAKEILRVLKKAGLDISNCRGQGYDGAANMSSEAVGTLAHIKKSPNAIYTHCCGHNLALVITTACKIPVINNVLATMKDASSMFARGSKKMTMLKEVVRKQNETYGNRKVVFDICVTRWVDNLDGYNMMLHTLPYIIEAFEVIALGFHIDEYPDWTRWDQESRTRAVH